MATRTALHLHGQMIDFTCESLKKKKDCTREIVKFKCVNEFQSTEV